MEERKILVARTAGFCFGVKRAVEKVYEQVNMGKQNIYTYGPIIHNEEVVTDLEKKGVRVLENEQELKNLMEGTVVIRSHGVPKEIYEVIEEKGLECVDALARLCGRSIRSWSGKVKQDAILLSLAMILIRKWKASKAGVKVR